MLRDHFHPPLSLTRPWSSVHASWAANLASAINDRLPDGWFAGPQVKWAIEVDVATYDERGGNPTFDGGSATATLPSPTETLAFEMRHDTVRVNVYQERGELRLAAAIELVSPGNRDRRAARDSFVAKCDAILRDGCGLIIVDIVIDRTADLHAELLGRVDPDRLNASSESTNSHGPYHVAYRPFRVGGETRLSYWHRQQPIGQPMDDNLLFLKDGPVIEAPLAASYAETLRRLKITDPT